MICIILAAGYATRLYPLTANFPKPLLKVGDKTILDWLIDDIRSSGEVNSFIVVANHKFADTFSNWAPKDVTVIDDGTSTNETRLGAVRDILFAIDTIGIDDDMLVIAGDNVLDFSLVHFIRYARSKGSSAIMRYFEAEDDKLHRCGIVETGDNDLVISMEEKPAVPKSRWCCPPFYFYTKEDARRINEGIAAGCGTDAPGSYIAWLCNRVPVYAMEMPGKRYDIGSLDSYRQVCKTYKGIHIL